MVPKLAGLKQRSIASFDSIGRSMSHFCQRTLYSKGISSSQPNFILQRSCRIFLAVRTNGAAKPKGLNTDPIMDKLPLRIGGLSLTLTSKPNVLEFTLHCMLSARSTTCWRLISLMVYVRSGSGIVSRTSWSLLIHFISRKPPRCSKLSKSLTWALASSTEGNDFRQSLT